MKTLERAVCKHQHGDSWCVGSVRQIFWNLEGKRGSCNFGWKDKNKTYTNFTLFCFYFRSLNVFHWLEQSIQQALKGKTYFMEITE